MRSIAQLKADKKYRQLHKKERTIYQINWNKTEKGKKQQKRHNDSALGFILHSPIHNLKQRYDLIMENCAICDSPNVEFHHPNSEMPLHIYFLCKEHHHEQHRRN